MSDDETRNPLEFDLTDPGKVVRPEFGDAKLTVDRNLERYCGHHFVSIRPNSRRVICRTCRAELSAFEVLLSVATSWDHVTYRQAELERVNARIEELKAEETRAKARLRNARRQAEAPAAAEEFFNEYLLRLNAANTWGELHDAGNWAGRFSWLSPQQSSVLKEAAFRAKQRAEASAREAPRRKRRVRVLPGGKGGSK